MPEFFTRFEGRQALLDYAAQTGIPVTSTKAKPYSVNPTTHHANFSHGTDGRQYCPL
jgi:argininosuccinate synthase